MRCLQASCSDGGPMPTV